LYALTPLLIILSLSLQSCLLFYKAATAASSSAFQNAQENQKLLPVPNIECNSPFFDFSSYVGQITCVKGRVTVLLSVNRLIVYIGNLDLGNDIIPGVNDSDCIAVRGGVLSEYIKNDGTIGYAMDPKSPDFEVYSSKNCN
jgi:hypothetical protein